MSRNSRKKVESTPASECIVCQEDLGDSHQLVFDEVGVELELQKLLFECFNLKVVQDKNIKQAVCDNCLNDLIETVDIHQKVVEEQTSNPAGEGPSGGTGNKIIPTGDDAEIFDNESAVEVLDSEDELTEEMLEEGLLYSDPDSEEDDDVGLKNNSLSVGDDDSKDAEEGHTEGSQMGLDEDDEEFYENIDYLEDMDQNFDFRSYKMQSLNSKFDDIIFPSDIICQLCTESFSKHAELMEHIKTLHGADGSYTCVLADNCEPATNFDDMAYHLVFKHYDLNNISLYAQCPSCAKRFSTFTTFNKHSCNDTKALSRALTQCNKCGDLFQSNKRYRFHLQFHLDDHRPKGCLICDKMFADENHLFEHLFYEHEEHTDFTCIRCDRVFTTEENLASHKKVHEIGRSFKCQMCPKSYLYNQQLKDHVLAHHSNKRAFQCHICGKYLYKQSLLNKHITLHDKPEEKEVSCCSICGFVGESDADTEDHIQKHHKNDSESYIVVEKIDVAYCCEYCEMAFQNRETLRTHRNTHSKNQFFCNMCPLVYDEFKKLKTHKLTHVDYVDKRKTFPVMRHYLCDVQDCTHSYLQWTTLRSHKRNKHLNKNVFTCPKCSEEFTNSIRFNQHMQTVHSGAVHACPLCDKTYSSKMAISVHVARKHNSPKLHCDKCSSVFVNEYYLQRHITAMHSPAQCPSCNKVLKSLKNLQVHQRSVHNQEKRYFCRYCNKGYFNQCGAIEHEETVHKKSKRFQCNLCDYKAIYKQTLTVHMRAHNNESPYKCEICPKAFRRAYGLSLHMRRHFDIRDFVCPYEGCGAAYPNQGILNSHLRKKHPNGINVKPRKRRTIAITGSSPTENDKVKQKKSRRRFDVPITNVFVDDDDGLDDGVIGEPQNMPSRSDNNEINEENPDEPVAYIFEASGQHNPAVIVQRNESDHDYIVRPDDSKIYGNVIEEYEVVAADVVLQQ
ncbi:unnamed protein product [Hermetia illucens]|uniref:Uncharacterized protein n=1 Tax=Hermetia illucens TaxID=343691 RepID=A0A7R8UC34_HERIL|nr:zinc finger protein 595 [Hermetia illucens]CAD7077967.1 unnamed protein product [Hermetia illucens]